MLFCNLKIMDKNHILAGIALLGSVVGQPVKGQEEITDARVGKTRDAVVQVIDRLDWTPKNPTIKYPAALKKFNDLLLLMDDHKLTEAEHAEMLENAELLAKIDQDGAQEIRDSLLGVPTVIAEKEVAALNESPEERKIRLEKEKKVKELVQMMKNMNKAFFDKKNWATAHKKDVVEVDIWQDKVAMKFVSQQLNVSRADLAREPLAITEWNYKIDIVSSGTGIIGFWSYDAFNKPIRVNNDDRTFLQNGSNNITIPQGTVSIRFFLATSPSTQEIEVTGFNISKGPDGVEIVMDETK